MLSLLGELSERRPVLCVLDDAHWLDRGSVDALAFVARRLEAERVALVLAVRDPTARSVPVPDLPTMRVGALSPDAAARLLEEHAGVAVHADVRLRLVEATGGNALALVELAYALSVEELRGEHPLPVPLPLTSGVEQAFLDRVRRLPGPTQTLLLVAAADDTARLTTVGAAGARLGVELDVLAAAEHAGVVAVEGNALRFRHPLVRSAVYQGANSTDRRAVHRALAKVLATSGDADRAAWHRAAGALGPDPDAATALDDAAARARDRGAFAAAASALERAAELSAEPEPRARRLAGAALQAWFAGHTDRVRPLLAKARPLTADRALRADIDELEGMVELGAGVSVTAYRLLRRAAEEIAPHDPGRALEILTFAGEAASMASDAPAEVELGELAAALDAGDGLEERFLVDLLVGLAHHFAGDPVAAAEPLTRALAVSGELTRPTLLLAAGRAAMYLGDDAVAICTSAAVVQRARQFGEVGAVPIAAHRLALSELFAGRWTAGEATATESLRLSLATGQEELVPLAHCWLALHAALRGRADECHDHVAAAREIAARRPMGLIQDSALWALGVLDLGLGDAAAALAHLRPIAHPVVVGFSSLDRVEAAHQAGDRAAAQAWLTGLAQAAHATRQPWALARAAHGSALLAERAEAERVFAEALDHHARATPRSSGLAQSWRTASRCAGRDPGRRAGAPALGVRRLRAARRRPVGRAGAGRAARLRADRPRAGRRSCAAHPAGGAGGSVRRRGAVERGRGGAALPVPAHRRLPPAKRLREARDQLPDRAGPTRDGRRPLRTRRIRPVRTTGRAGHGRGPHTGPEEHEMSESHEDGLHVVVGASGGTGSAVVLGELHAAPGRRVRAINRSGRTAAPPGVEAVAADATDAAQMRRACAGAAVVYNCVNPPFARWRELFPAAVDGVLAGASAAGAVLVFADDTWMYGRVTGPMTEDTPVRPVSGKGVLRAWLADRVLAAHHRGDVRAVDRAGR